MDAQHTYTLTAVHTRPRVANTEMTDATNPMQSTLLRILLIEDNPGDARLLQEYLCEAENFRCELVQVERLAQAFEIGGQNRFDIIFLDLTLPDSRGLASIAKLQEVIPNVPIIVLTGLSDERTAVEAVRQGAQDYLLKSQISGRDLARAVRYAIERFRVLEALRESEERYALAARAANDGLWDWNLLTNEVYYSPRWCAMLGYGEDEIRPNPEEWFQRIHPADAPGVRDALDAHLRGDSQHFEAEYRMRHRHGGYRWILTRGLALFDAQKNPYRIAGSQTDITVRKRAEQRLVHDALHDPLTGLPNRTYFHQQLEQSLLRLRSAPDNNFALLFMDLDRFKIVNDSLGHLTGDELLRAIAERLKNSVPPGDLIARLGGDEFAVLLHRVNGPHDAMRVAQNIIQAMKHPFHVRGRSIFATCSIGISLSDQNYSHPEEMLRDADNAMYRAKALGPGRFQIFDAVMHTRALSLWQLETDLRQALEREEFRIYFQPIVSLQDGHLVGFEALVRWQHPQRGLLYPNDFLAVAEEVGMLSQLDRWMIHQGVRYIQTWNQQYANGRSFFLSVNLSDGLVRQPGLPNFMQDVLEKSGLNPSILKLEITETVVMNDAINVTRTLSELRGMDLRLCIDDFGTGYSSLGSLHTYPVDTLKIDSSFIHRMCEDPNSRELIRTIITLAHDLDLDVVAEGVETPEQAQMLQKMGCEYGQGTLFAPAMAPKQSCILLSRNPHWPILLQ